MDVLLKNFRVKCIIVAIDLEFLALIKQLNIVDKHIKKVNNECIIAECIDRKIVVAQAGVGKAKAEECAKLLHENYPNISGFVSAGLAGALSEQLTIGDIIVGDSITYIEQEEHKIIKFLDTIKIPTIESFNVKYGSIACSDEFINDTKIKQYLMNEYKAICVEMESSGVLNFANKKGTSFLAIKVISDNANEKAIRSIIRSYINACNTLACYLDQIIDNIWN